MIDRIAQRTLGGVAALVLFALMSVTCVDVVGRYVLNRPITGGLEITELLLALLIFAGVPLVTLRDGHVTVDLFDAITPPAIARAQHVAACLLGAVCTAFLAWRLWLRADATFAAGETTAVLKLPIAYLTYSMSVLMGCATLAFVVLAPRRPEHHLNPDL